MLPSGPAHSCVKWATVHPSISQVRSALALSFSLTFFACTEAEAPAKPTPEAVATVMPAAVATAEALLIAVNTHLPTVLPSPTPLSTAESSGAAQERETAAFTVMQPSRAVESPVAAASPGATGPVPASVATPPATLDPDHVGIQVHSPLDGVQVPYSAVVSGSQARPTPPGRHVWAFVKANVHDARWYPWHRGEIIAHPDGTWAIDLYLGGSAGIQHEIQIGTVGEALHTELSTYIERQPDQPLPELPDGFVPEARIAVTVE